MIRRTIALLLLPLLAAFLPADEPKAAPARLTKEQLSQGWIDLFDGESFFGWDVRADTKWSVQKGYLTAPGKDPATLLTTTAFDHYELLVEYQTRQEGSEVQIGAYLKGGVQLSTKQIKLEPTGLGKGSVKITVRYGKVTGVTTNITADPIGLAGSATGYKLAADPNEKQVTSPGQIGLRGAGLLVRAVRLRPLAMTSLFNGKNLDGWKIFEGKKGKFGVDTDGNMTVKDGPGDIATVGEYGDFVLQLECKTNGKGLNSGIFFRAIPGQYQQDYEAQIHNGFLDKPKQIDIEVHDPKTHELKEKKKVETLAADFGSGAIYRRIPARKQAAQDNEWFTMTVVASGRHIATWVNGVQTVDWVDNRPLKDNARQGCCLSKGVISIQAHDPTTDLLFRNLRIIDWKK